MVLEIHNGLSLCAGGLRQEFPLHLAAQSCQDRFDDSVIIIEHSLLVCRTVDDLFGQAELTVQLRGQVPDLFQQIILKAAVQLGHLFSGIGVCNAILTLTQLLLNLLQPLVRFDLPAFRLDRVRQLNDHIQLVRAGHFVDLVLQVQLSDQPLQRRARLVHHGIEGILDDRRHLLGNDDFFLNSLAFVVQKHLDLIRPPLGHLPCPQTQDIVSAGNVRIEIRIGRNDGDAALIKHAHHGILNKLPSCLVRVRVQRQAVVQSTLNGLHIPFIFIQPHMPDLNGRRVHSNPVINCRDNASLVSSCQPGSVWPVGAGIAKRRDFNASLRGIPIVPKGIPGMLEPFTK